MWVVQREYIEEFMEALVSMGLKIDSLLLISLVGF